MNVNFIQCNIQNSFCTTTTTGSFERLQICCYNLNSSYFLVEFSFGGGCCGRSKKKQIIQLLLIFNYNGFSLLQSVFLAFLSEFFNVLFVFPYTLRITLELNIKQEVCFQSH